MKDSKKSVDIGAAVIVFSLGLAFGYLYIMSQLVQIADGVWIFDEGAVIVTALMISVEVTAAAAVLLIRYFFPYLTRRAAALRALGNNGFGKLAKDPVARLAYRGIYSALNGDNVKAEEYLCQAISRTEEANNKLFCYEWLLKVYESEQNQDKILWCFRKTAETAPDNVNAQCRLGQAYFSDGRLDNALFCFEQALRYNPREGYAIYMTAKIQLIRGEDEKCLESLNRLREINENHPMVYAELAVYHAMHDEYEQCDECFRKAALCGFREIGELERRIDAIKRFRRGETYNGEDLPGEYYRRVEKEDAKSTGKD